MKGYSIETDLKVMDYVRDNYSEMFSMTENNKILIFNYDWSKKKYNKMSEMTLDELKNLSVDLYPCSFYKEDQEGHEDYDKCVLLLRSKSHSVIKEIDDYAHDNWEDIVDYVLHGDNSVFPEGNDISWLCPYEITFRSKDNENNGLSTYTVYLDDVCVGNFCD